MKILLLFFFRLDSISSVQGGTDYDRPKHRHAKRARVIFCDRSIRRTVYSNDLVKSFWVAMYSKK